ncbi:peptidoglycan DD-metalloendopeptidase family protein [Telluria aromaticivorans]|uniref:Peptidoglycan DD-metalloendopeptidase family protein n=1 Tax=Telluria aromaticivorans TaxID=2725995 RepID=A0A7Y2JX18_9BURK|nr:peptidoglycan DD-metalloendopeptidase family protein [Telluria aromaticivorans]NNG22283.1 peptidoglycan DD-metalloendopeptidase family protein [Telluria aromaticivorans]
MNQAPRTTQAAPLALLTLAIGLLAGCTSLTRHAPVVERTSPPSQSRPAPVRAEEPKDEKGMHTVRRGDTLLRIALDNGQNYRDLVAWNNLRDPDDIKVGQVLRVAPPERGERTANIQTQPVPAPPPATPPRKTTPRADKQPYSDATAASAQKDPGTRVEPAPAVTPPAAAPAPTIAAGSTVTANDDEKLSWMWPSDGRIVATFDEGRNKGIDIAGKAGQQVVAAGPGKVMYAGSGIRGYGNLVIVKHSNSLLSAYAHNRKIVVKEGDNVAKGQVIAEMGDSDADSVKLHFEIRQQGKPVDPSRFLPGR